MIRRGGINFFWEVPEAGRVDGLGEMDALSRRVRDGFFLGWDKKRLRVYNWLHLVSL